MYKGKNNIFYLNYNECTILKGNVYSLMFIAYCIFDI